MVRILFILIFFYGTNLYAQETVSIDSLKSLINTLDRHDTLKILDQLSIAKAFYFINRDSSRHYNELARDYSKIIEYRRGLARANTNLALLLINENKTIEAEELLNQALSVVKAINDPEIELYIYSNLGILNHYGANYDIAVNYYLKCTEIARSIANSYEEARALLNIGDVFNQNNIADKAKDFVKKARNLSIEKHPILFAYSSILLSELYKNEQDSAWYYVNGAFEVVDQITSPQILYNMHSGRAAILADELKYDVAYTDYLQALAFAEELGQAYAIASCYCLLGNNGNNRDNYEEAEAYFLNMNH